MAALLKGLDNEDLLSDFREPLDPLSRLTFVDIAFLAASANGSNVFLTTGANYDFCKTEPVIVDLFSGISSSWTRRGTVFVFKCSTR